VVVVALAPPTITQNLQFGVRVKTLISAPGFGHHLYCLCIIPKVFKLPPEQLRTKRETPICKPTLSRQKTGLIGEFLL
tara:strand:+ start:449 stop:682 length:234 start_codon:yes stop_codon:yes gene_type:complete